MHRHRVALFLGDRECEVRHASLRVHESAFVLRLPEREVLNAMRRGERLQASGVADSEVLGRGALPVDSDSVGRRCMRPTLLAQHARVASRPLALAALRAIVEGRLQAPRATSPALFPPGLESRCHLFHR